MSQRFLLCGLAALAALLAPSGASAGSGRFHDGVFDLYVTLGWDASAAEITTIQGRFTSASQLLFDATDGQARLGTVTIFDDNTGLEFADVLITQGSGTANATGADLGVFGESLDLFTSDDINPDPGDPVEWTFRTVAHEIAHYVFDVRDEYDGPSPGINGECLADMTATACIMDDYKSNLNSSEFCWADNHDPDGDTFQESRHGHSCWQTIEIAYPMMAVPAAAPVDAAPAGFVAPTYQVFDDPTVRVALVLDRSGSMNDPGGIAGGATRIEDLRTFAEQYVDLMGLGDVELGIVTYSSAAATPFPLRALDDALDVADAKTALPATAAGQTNIGGGLIAGRDLLTATPADGPLILILMSDGHHNHPPGDPTQEPLAVVPSLVSNGIHVHTVALGDSTNEALMRDIAKQTGGIFWKANDSVELEPVFSGLAALVRGGSLLDAAQRHLIRPGERHIPQGPTPPPMSAPVLPLLRRIYVEEGNLHATFNLGWSTPGTRLQMFLRSPGGREISAGLPPRLLGGVKVFGGARYQSIQVQAAEKGWWEVSVGWVSGTVETTYDLLPTIETPAVRGFAHGETRATRTGVSIALEAVARDRVPATGLTVQAVHTNPAGVTAAVQLYDDGAAAHGDEAAGDGIYSALVPVTRNGVHHFEIGFAAQAGTARAIAGEEPGLNPDNAALHPIRTFRRTFPVDVPVTGLPVPIGTADGSGAPRTSGP